jgi:CRISPR-associated protein Csb2
MLRALLATGYTKLPEWQSGRIPDQAAGLIEKLASVLPCYRLPEAVGAHTRHYMPIKGKTTLVLDARAVTGIDHQPLLVHWNIELENRQKELLRKLACRLGYLGRAESWTECELIEDMPLTDDWIFPCERDSSTVHGPGWEQVPLIAPVSGQDYAVWRQTAYETACEGQKLTAAQRKKINALYPADIVASLQAETGWLQRNGWSQPPGSRKVLYWMPVKKAIGVTAPAPAPAKSERPAQFALLAITADARSRSPMPLIHRTLPQAELLHTTMASIVGKTGNDQASAELLGLDDANKPLKGHRHAHILPLGILKQDRHLDHFLIWAPAGLGNISQRVLHQIRQTYMKGGIGELAIRFAGAGTAKDFKMIPGIYPLLSKARVWQSLTPLVLPRFRKKSGKNTPNGQILAELASRNIPAPDNIEWLRDESIALRHFIRKRRKKAPPPEDYGYAVRLTFAEPVSGPICLGYASHFGLGLFAPVPDDGSTHLKGNI